MARRNDRMQSFAGRILQNINSGMAWSDGLSKWIKVDDWKSKYDEKKNVISTVVPSVLQFCAIIHYIDVYIFKMICQVRYTYIYIYTRHIFMILVWPLAAMIYFGSFHVLSGLERLRIPRFPWTRRQVPSPMSHCGASGLRLYLKMMTRIEDYVPGQTC